MNLIILLFSFQLMFLNSYQGVNSVLVEKNLDSHCDDCEDGEELYSNKFVQVEVNPLLKMGQKARLENSQFYSSFISEIHTPPPEHKTYFI